MITDEAIEEYARLLVIGAFKNPALAKHRSKHEKVAMEQVKKLFMDGREDTEIAFKRLHAWLHKWNIPADMESLKKLELEMENDRS